MFPADARLTKPIHVSFFYGIHLVENGMVDVGLQLTGKAAKDFHLDNGCKAQVLQSLDVMADRPEVMVKTGKAVIRSAFSSKMSSSHVRL